MIKAWKRGYDEGRKDGKHYQEKDAVLVEQRFARYKAAVRGTLAKLMRSTPHLMTPEEALRNFDAENSI